ncbi:sulfotransferase 1A1-like [Lytechinus variegatus]|uniref:sulfotransferase 1A1-like n=1 Tax=Lytechinus variegatus TaxID=7654 RepID=UPI001BB1E4C4|nr:sulfotransferase 1A1-like [Lytechinus variegatus]
MADPEANSIPRSIVAHIRDSFLYEGIRIASFVTPDDMSGIRNMEVREDDVILATYPKSGTHWMTEILLLVRNSGIPLSSQDRFEQSSQLLENPAWIRGVGKSYEHVASMPSPRLYKTHLPIQFLPKQIWEKKPKIVYLARNPKDCVVSFYNFCKSDIHPLEWNEAFDFFISDEITYGSIWEHQYGFWKHRNDDNFLYVDFEDMKKDPAGNAAKVAAHLGYDLSAEQLAEVTRLSSLKEMKATYARLEDELGDKGKLLTHAAGILPLLYKGTVGGWKNIFTVAQNETFQKHQEMIMKDFDEEFRKKLNL